MKAGKKMLESRIEEFCRASSQLLQSIHTRCDTFDGTSGNGRPKKKKKKAREEKTIKQREILQRVEKSI